MLRIVLSLLVIISLAGCERRNGEAIVVAKEHIAAAPPTAERPTAEHASSPANGEEQIREIKDDEITVDGYVMRPEVRGTSRDPRALKEEQWRVNVRMISDGRTFNVQADLSQFDKLKAGDRVQVRYHVGKYTGTVWGAELDKSKK
ncbi:MAG TPA: hypothetical protein VH254_01920 [Candidatus Udaeobacter sp.]|nr:hypothetical protein [Candidatus Udaeobacter sp.]